MSFVLRKSLLAVAISVAASPVLALTLNGAQGDLNNYGVVQAESQTFDEMVIDGAYEGAADGVNLKSVTVNGDFRNLGAITSIDDRGDNYPAAIEIGSLDLLNGAILGRPTTIAGSLINSGNLVANGINATGIRLRNTQVAGDVVNTGRIQATARNEQDPGRGIDLDKANINGRFLNLGDVSIDGWLAKALNVSNTEIGSGHLINGGSLTATGDEATGLHVAYSSVGTIDNSGVISASGAYANGLDLEQGAKLEGLKNSGLILANGEEAVGVLVDAAQINSGITNTGVISGSGIGIEVEGLSKEGPSALKIENSGTIHGGIAAIKGNGDIDLNWKGGSIDGDLLGLTSINVSGDQAAEFYGQNLEVVNSLNIASESTLNLNAVTSTIAGDLVVQEHGALGLAVSEESPTNKALLTVDGKATLANGSELVVNAKGADFAKNGQSYTLIQANELENNGVAVWSSSALLEVRAVSLGLNNVGVTVAAKNNSDIQTIIANGGGNGNSQRAGAEFVNAASELAISNPDDPVLAALINAGSSEEEVARVAKQLSPEVNAAAAKAALSGQHLVSTAVGTRISSVRQGMSSGDAFATGGTWFQVLHSDANQNARDGIEGYDSNSRGFAVGVDGQLNEQTVLGVAYSYVDTDVDADDGNKTQVGTNALTAYGSWTSGGLFVDGSMTYGKNRNSSKRYIAGTEAKGHYDSSLFGLNALAGYAFDIGNNLVVEPRIAARYSLVDIDGFAEKGSSASLRTSSQRMEVGELGAGVRLAGQFYVAGGVLEPEIKAMAYHDFIADESDSRSTYLLGGNSFVTNGVSTSRDSYEMSVGASYRKGDVTLGLGYDRLTKAGFEANTFTAKVRYDF